jgi:biopolymer transport protein ExbD
MNKVYLILFFSLINSISFAQNAPAKTDSKEPIQQAPINQPSQATSKESEVKEEIAIDKIKVFKSGKIELNGKEVSLQDLKKELVQLKELNGEVWYYSESSKGYPSDQAMKVLRLILDNKIPYKLSIQPDFSDYALVKPKKDAAEKSKDKTEEKPKEEKSEGLIK